MTRSSRFLLLVVLQLCIPAVVHWLVDLNHGSLAGLRHLLVNYLYLAVPHLVVATVALWRRARTTATLLVLALLNVLLIAFQLWMLIEVPRNESPVVWLLYIPLWGLVLAAWVLAWIVVEYSTRRAK